MRGGVGLEMKMGLSEQSEDPSVGFQEERRGAEEECEGKEEGELG
jgi:hypothetical protein